MSGLPPHVRGTVVTMGTFDGVHLGHQAILRDVRRRARARNGHAVLLTFDPHPLSVVRPEVAPPLLTLPDEKKEILAQLGLDYAAFVAFTLEFSRYSPEEFVEDIVVPRFRPAEVVIGYDHGFGRGRAGDVSVLERMGEVHGFEVSVVGGVETDGSTISSTRVRGEVASGDMEGAAAGLGRPYSFRGTVIRGLGRGRALGFPTANLAPPPPDKLLPAEGIYAVRATLGSERVDGLLHLGPRPTFADAPPAIELFLIDFDRDIYGERVIVDVLHRLREVRAYESGDDLAAQMRRDLATGLEYFRGRGG
ncbi:MAG: bifunctional riboflavin kinase/FAD synthetase [Gemmatimonadota bacterium]|uniref:bifunctional riboflavin kinase/FAD synthetase n=1 Tax=Candidatus Palauibacter scopulicola TaxID=3056741 RepID=UPI0023897FB2|nr:bifunctional riboflavin kinase/FAD synthetase [Candidatus Palauibacter scopulicola]MDE2663951.1 bifunctional riboflavin kinase/FAD synthetase [Candidatus Palauibacter scopulicola]